MRALKSKSLVFDIFGAFVRAHDGWIAIADLLILLNDLGVDDNAVRSAVSRFTGRGLLERQSRHGAAGYALTIKAIEILEEGDERIYRRLEPAAISDGWSLVVFSVPEDKRSERHKLRSRLGWLGYGNLNGGVWIAPGRMRDPTIRMVRALGLEEHVDVFAATYRGLDDLAQLVSRCWDLEALGDGYRMYLKEFVGLADKWARLDPMEHQREAFRDYVGMLHEWRKLPYLDPGLPPELLPADWEGRAAAELFSELRARLEDPAVCHVSNVVGDQPVSVS